MHLRALAVYEGKGASRRVEFRVRALQAVHKRRKTTKRPKQKPILGKNPKKYDMSPFKVLQFKCVRIVMTRKSVPRGCRRLTFYLFP